jgi:transposase InsO family protein
LQHFLAAFQGSSPASRRQWRGCLFEEVLAAEEKGQAVSVLCQMSGLSRAGFYRWRAPRQATPVAMELRDQMQKIAVEWPTYGYRRMTAELQQCGFAVNHKRVLRMMREDNLLCIRGRLFVVTTDSRHSLPVYPNLAREMNPTAMNQLWVADITYSALSSTLLTRVQVPPVLE